jgi:hypothetical protein
MVTEKYIKAYLKEYERDEFTSRKGMEEHLEEFMRVHEELSAGMTLEEQISKWLFYITMENPASFLFKEAFAASDPVMLNNALYHSFCIQHIRNIHSSSTDHGRNYRIALNALAAGMKERIELLLPEECGMSTNNHTVVTALTNLLMALWYKNKEFEETVRQKAERTLGTKQAAIDYIETRYLLALLDGDPAEAGVQLDLYCRGVPKIREEFMTKFDKMFWARAHGLYNLAFFVWDKEKALQIPPPEPECFCKGFAEWQKANDFKPGKSAIEYLEPLKIINQILQTEPPRTHLHQPYLNYKERLIADGKNPSNYRIPGNTKQWCTDSERFKKEMVKNIFKNIDDIGGEDII